MSILNSCNLRAPFFQFDRKIFYILHQKYLVGGKNNLPMEEILGQSQRSRNLQISFF